MARRVVDLRSRLQDAARRLPGAVASAEEPRPTGPPPDAPAPAAEDRTAGDAPPPASAPSVAPDEPSASAPPPSPPAQAPAPPPTPSPSPRPRRRRRASRTRVRRAPRRRDPFAARLRTLEREIDRALANAGGERDRGAAALLQEAGEQVLAFYADVARAFLDGGLEAAFIRLRMIGTADAVDEFGFDAAFHSRVEPLLRFLYERWWRVDVSGVRHVPRKGRVLLVANHSGGLFPYDGLMITHALRARRVGAGLPARPLVEDGAYHFPFAASPLARLGVVRASAANAERLLGRDEAAIVFPEGIKGSTKYYRERYRLQRFARGGFVSLALRTAAPLVPVAVIGAEEIYPVLARWQWLARLLGVPYLPVTPTFPWLGLVGLLPLPTKWRLVFGAPIDLAAAYGTAAHDDEVLVNQLQETVRERIQRMLIDALRERDSVFTG